MPEVIASSLTGRRLASGMSTVVGGGSVGATDGISSIRAVAPTRSRPVVGSTNFMSTFGSFGCLPNSLTSVTLTVNDFS